MKTKDFKYIYGPVPSWRLGSSLGIDPISQAGKVCTFDCLYCQLGKTENFTGERKIFISVTKIIEELDLLPTVQFDYITFSGRGEPTLAGNLGQMIKAIKKIRKEKIAILTNSSLLNRRDVQEDLLPADFVVAKLDADSQKVFDIINKPMEAIKFDAIMEGIKDFRGIYKGKLALQIMFITENKKYVEKIAGLTKEIDPDEVQINTPLRPCGVKPLSKTELGTIESYFNALNVVSVYKAEKKKVKPISNEDTLKRRGKI
ncbi:MAG: radical SAM protein [Candidatus Omnitrophica bacterium]|nr:radical SAM protein [Candidatus Omnitrophota bacterium]MBU4590507.1 radical SAM protein [Candidatus Omnitrophota bacterium]